MEISSGITASLAGRYASALYELANEQGQAAAVEGDLERLADGLRESADFAALIRNPQVGCDEAARAVAAFTELTREYPEGPLVMVSHDAFNTALIRMLDPSLDGINQRTACYNQISRHEGRWRVDFYDRKPQ